MAPCPAIPVLSPYIEFANGIFGTVSRASWLVSSARTLLQVASGSGHFDTEQDEGRVWLSVESIDQLRNTLFERILRLAEMTLHIAESRIITGDLLEDNDVTEAIFTLRNAIAKAQRHWDHQTIAEVRFASSMLARLMSNSYK